VIFVPDRQRHFTLVELSAVLLKYCRELAEVQCSKAGRSFCITAFFQTAALHSEDWQKLLRQLEFAPQRSCNLGLLLHAITSLDSKV
jgi:hypothetical protein